MSQYFHFTIGPVQGFVSQARRTRDFWAGSFLLSWLSGVAMLAIQRQGGEINFPIPPDGYLDWLEGKGKNDAPRQGAIPNRFKALQATVPADFDGKIVAETVRQAWQALAKHVWQQDLQLVASAQTQAVWDRQHAAFWEISWVITPEENASNLLDRRKNWRNHLPPAEPGVKCNLMEGWQELSGIEAMDKKGNDQRRKFWEQVRTETSDTDFSENEMLCGLAFVKRRFARHFESFKAEIAVGNLSLQGWKLETGVPSVNYMAAVHWLEQVIDHADQDKVVSLLETAQGLAGRDEWSVRIRCLHEKAKQRGLNRQYQQTRRELIALDGALFMEHVRNNEREFHDRKGIAEFERKLKALDLKNPAPSPFYAVLLMDGDSLGKQMSVKENQEPIAAALNDFTAAVPATVQKHNGFLIYAGGDDVLALLPLEDALPCALACREDYTKAFEAHKIKIGERQGETIKTTISAAVVFAHVKVALGEVLRQAHRTLDDDAKDGAGRDAIAIKVIKPGGEHLCWAQPWEIALTDDKTQLKLEALAAQFQQAESKDQQFSSKFFYHIHERFSLLGNSLSEEEQTALLAVDYLASEPAKQDGKTVTMDKAKEIIKPLLEQCRPVTRDKDLPIANWKKEKAPTAAAALVVRFLAHKGVEGR